MLEEDKLEYGQPVGRLVDRSETSCRGDFPLEVAAKKRVSCIFVCLPLRCSLPCVQQFYEVAFSCGS